MRLFDLCVAKKLSGGGSGGGDSRYTELIQRTITTVSDADVTSIGLYAFYGCGSLTSVNFPNATQIREGAFAYCISLTSVEFPNVTSIGAAAFFLSANLSTIILHKRATIAAARAIPSQTIVYVENADLDWYSTATNWSAIYADGRIKSIEELPS